MRLDITSRYTLGLSCELFVGFETYSSDIKNCLSPNIFDFFSCLLSEFLQLLIVPQSCLLVRAGLSVSSPLPPPYHQE